MTVSLIRMNSQDGKATNQGQTEHLVCRTGLMATAASSRGVVDVVVDGLAIDTTPGAYPIQQLRLLSY